MSSEWYVSKERGVLYAVWAHEYGSHMAAFHDAQNRNSVLQSGPYQNLPDLYKVYPPSLVSTQRPNLTGGSGSTGSSGGTSKTGSTGGNRADVVQEALNSIGHAYLFGGAPGTSGVDPWDCSSCTNYNFGRVNGLSIPGFPNGSYDGSTHGPSTVSWLAAQGTVVGSIDRSECEGGDIACWQTHMGTFINANEMVSAQNPTDGTQRSGVDGFISGEQLVCLRLATFGPGGITLPELSFGSPKALDAITREVARSSQALIWKRMRIQRTMTRRF